MVDAQAHPLVDMFEQQLAKHDLRQGTARTPQGTREIFLSTDVLRGVYEALSFEAGEAWGLVVHRCGQLWGERVTQRLWDEAVQHAGTTPSDLGVEPFLAWMRDWFRHSGWGDTVFDLRDAEQHGVVWVTLHFSLFREALDPCPDRADYLVSGLLGVFFGRVAGQPLDAVELPPGDDPAVVMFAVSGPERIEAVREAIEEGADTAGARSVLLDG